MKNFDDDEVEPGTGVGPANLSLPNETTKCDPQLRSGLASSSQETNFSETLSTVRRLPFFSGITRNFLKLLRKHKRREATLQIGAGVKKRQQR